MHLRASKPETATSNRWGRPTSTLTLLGLLTILVAYPLQADTVATGTASYYTVASCLREGTSGIMANGKELVDENYTCATWGHRFGTILKVTRTDTGRSTRVVVSDRGPAKSLYRKGRIIDLSYAAMHSLDGCKQGVIPVTVEVVGG